MSGHILCAACGCCRPECDCDVSFGGCRCGEAETRISDLERKLAEQDEKLKGMALEIIDRDMKLVKAREALEFYAMDSIDHHNYHATMGTTLTAKARIKVLEEVLVDIADGCGCEEKCECIGIVAKLARTALGKIREG